MSEMNETLETADMGIENADSEEKLSTQENL